MRARWVLAGLLLGTLWIAAGCGDDSDVLPCEELAAVCPTCPDTPDGITAKRSCELTSERGAEIDCQARLDERTYETYGCQYP